MGIVLLRCACSDRRDKPVRGRIPGQGNVMNIHAIQLEVDRSLYLDADLRHPGAGFDRMNNMISALVSALADEALGSANLIAAE